MVKSFSPNKPENTKQKIYYNQGLYGTSVKVPDCIIGQSATWPIIQSVDDAW